MIVRSFLVMQLLSFSLNFVISYSILFFNIQKFFSYSNEHIACYRMPDTDITVMIIVHSVVVLRTRSEQKQYCNSCLTVSFVIFLIF